MLLTPQRMTQARTARLPRMPRVCRRTCMNTMVYGTYYLDIRLPPSVMVFTDYGHE